MGRKKNQTAVPAAPALEIPPLPANVKAKAEAAEAKFQEFTAPVAHVVAGDEVVPPVDPYLTGILEKAPSPDEFATRLSDPPVSIAVQALLDVIRVTLGGNTTRELARVEAAEAVLDYCLSKSDLSQYEGLITEAAKVIELGMSSFRLETRDRVRAAKIWLRFWPD